MAQVMPPRKLLDTRLLLTLVFLRRAGFGLTNQVLALFLASLGFLKTSIGVFMTLTLLGDTLLLFLLTWHTDAWGRRLVMLGGCVLMFGSGLVFALTSNYWLLLAAAVAGVISTSGDETGPFKSVEEACLAKLGLPKSRPKTFATYGLLGTLGLAVGASLGGFLVDFFTHAWGWSELAAYRAVFVGYSAVAVAKLAMVSVLLEDCEVKQNSSEAAPASEETLLLEASLAEGSVVASLATESSDASPRSGLGISATSVHHLQRLLVVFMLDSFGYGFMPPAWIVYHFRTVFHVLPSALGGLFFATNIIDAGSSVALMFTFRLLGPVRAILAAQLPSAGFFALVPFCHTFVPAAAFYFLFCACATMDVVPRQVLLTAIIPEHDLARVLGLVNIAKTFARCIGPLFTGPLADHGRLDVAFWVNSACLVVADLILGFSYAHRDAQLLAEHS